MASLEEGKKILFRYLEGFNGDLKISFSKCNNIKIPCIFRFPVSIHVIFEPCGNKYKDINLQPLKNICVLVAVVLKRVHNLLKEILKNRRNAFLVRKEKALSPDNPAFRLNKIV